MAVQVVTGGAGFIGSHLVDALLALGHRVRVVDDFSTGLVTNLDPRAELITGDVADPAVMHGALAGAEGCFHLAAVASVARANEDWLGTHRANQSATISVLQAARDHGRLPVVYASSAAVYGDLGELRLHEGLVPQPLSAYGADKFGSELHARVAFSVHATPTMGLRFFNVYGPRQDPSSPYSGVISIFADRVVRGLPIVINGDGMQTRDFVYVGDVVRYLLAGMERLRRVPEASVFNVCTGRATTLLGLVEVLGAITGTIPGLSFGPTRPADIRTSLGSPAAARVALRIGAPVGLAEGLGMLLAEPQPTFKVAV